MTDIPPVTVDGSGQVIQRKLSPSSSSDVVEKGGIKRTNAPGENDNEEGAQQSTFNRKLRVLFLIGLAALILGWWISATVLKVTRGRWRVCRLRDASYMLTSPAGLYRRSTLGSS